MIDLGTGKPASVANRGWLVNSVWQLLSLGTSLMIGGTRVVRLVFFGALMIVYWDLLS